MPISQSTDPATGAKSYTVKGNGGPFTKTGSEGEDGQQVPTELFLGNAGTAMRPLAAALCFGDGNYVLVSLLSLMLMYTFNKLTVYIVHHRPIF